MNNSTFQGFITYDMDNHRLIILLLPGPRWFLLHYYSLRLVMDIQMELPDGVALVVGGFDLVFAFIPSIGVAHVQLFAPVDDDESGSPGRRGLAGQFVLIGAGPLVIDLGGISRRRRVDDQGFAFDDRVSRRIGVENGLICEGELLSFTLKSRFKTPLH